MTIQEKISRPPIIRTMIWLTLFSIAMGYLETAVVVYLRELYYPKGFGFPLNPVPYRIAVAEFWREVATVIMLAGVGILAGKTRQQRFVFFLYSFAIWDIFYYVFLYVLLGWPQSLFTWDILFLIPVPWVGPVICPCLVSLTMIVLALLTVYWDHRRKKAVLSRLEKTILLAGCAVILLSFMWDYFMYVQQHPSGRPAWTLSSDKELFSESAGYVPQHFSWGMFIPGQVMLAGAVGLFALRMRKEKEVVEN